MKAITAIINGTPVYYKQHGDGVPIICIHGIPEDHRAVVGCFESVFQEVDGFRRIYLDLPGLGKSPTNPLVKNADDMLNTLFQFIEQVLGSEHFYLIGQSYGGYLALGLTQQLSERIKGVYLLCPCVVADRKRRTLPARTIIRDDAIDLSADDNPMDFEVFEQTASVITNATWERYKIEILPGLQCADNEFVEQYQTAGYGLSFESELKNIRFEKTVTFLMGRQDDCVGYRDAYQLIECFPHASFQIVDGAGHNLQIERPSIFRNSVLGWLERMEHQTDKAIEGESWWQSFFVPTMIQNATERIIFATYIDREYAECSFIMEQGQDLGVMERLVCWYYAESMT